MKRLFFVINIVLITSISFLSVDTVYKIFAAQLNPGVRPKHIAVERNLTPVELEIPPLSQYRTILRLVTEHGWLSIVNIPRD